MKKILLASFLSFSFLSQAQTTYPSGVTGCIARWNFTGTGTPSYIPDVSGNNNNGLGTDLTYVPGFHGRTNHAVHFNGLTSVVEVPHDTILNPQQISIVALVRFTGFYSAVNQVNNIIYKSYSYFTPGCWAMNVDEYAYDQNNNTFSPGFEQMKFVGPDASKVPAPPSGDYLAAGNDWYLLVTTYDGNILNRYQIRMDSVTRNNSISPSSTHLLGMTLGSNMSNVFMGKTQHPTYPYNVNGDFDEIALFNKALTPAEVQSVYDYLWGAGLAVPEAKVLDEVSVRITGNVLQVENPKGGSPLDVTVYDMAGRILAQHHIANSGASIEMADAASGLLMVRIACDGAVVTRKVSCVR